MNTYETKSYRPAQSPTPPWWWLCLAVFTAAMLLVTWLGVRSVWTMNTLRYELTSGHLVITAGPTVTSIPRDEIRRAEVLTPTGGFRRNGTGLPGLQLGHWSFRETGSIRMFSTATRPLTVLETPDRKLGISPADTEGFRQALQSGVTGQFPPVYVPKGFGTYFFLFMMLPLPLLTILLLVYLGGVGRSMRYSLGTDALEIRVGPSRVRVPYGQITSASAENPAGTPWKTVGAWLPGLFWGGFNWPAAGGGLRMYATQAKPIVLIRTELSVYGITPEATAAFLDDLKRRLLAAR